MRHEPSTATGLGKYRLVDPDGSIPAVHVRSDQANGDKRFWWQEEDGTPGLGGRAVASLPLYGVARLALGPDAPVFLTEGEKAADSLARLSLVALGTVTGAAAIPDQNVLSVLGGRDVRLWPDNDDVGRSHMDRIAERLRGIAASVAFVDWPAANEGGDAADFVLEGATAFDVLALPFLSAPVGEGSAAERNWSGRMLSAAAESSRRAERNLVFRTAREFASTVPAEVPWIARPFVVAGSITGIDGKIKAAGKTTLMTHVMRSVLDGAPFLGQATRRSPVVFLTEQSGPSLRESLRRADLLDRGDLFVLSWAETAGFDWASIVEAAVDECVARGAGLLVVDTLSRFAGIRGDGENSAGEADAAMAPLQTAAAQGLGVVVLRHERKSGGDVGDSGRGSSAFGGAVDILLALRRRGGNAPANTRVIMALSRFSETPDELVIELTDQGYVVTDTLDETEGPSVASRVTEFLASVDEAQTIEEMLTQIGCARTTLQKALDQLEGEGQVARSGAGVRGDPYRFVAQGPTTAARPPAAGPRSVDALADLLRAGDDPLLWQIHD
jgi:hypothetical protein